MARSKKIESWNALPLVAVEFLGFALAFYLFLISARVIHTENMPCVSGGIFACASILRGKFSYFGPFSIAGLGLIYFVVSLALTALLDDRRPWMRPLKVASVVGGLFFLSYLRATEAVYIHKICLWCYSVAAVTLIQAALVLAAWCPPLPDMRFVVRLGVVLTVFVLMFGASVGIALATGRVENAFLTFLREDKSATVETPESPNAAKADSAVASNAQPASSTNSETANRPLPTPAPRATVTPAVVAAADTPKPTATPRAETAAPSSRPVINLPPASLDNDEARILRRQGWQVVGETKHVNTAIREGGPVLLVVFDPFCEECAAYITGALRQADFRDLGVMQVAIESSNLIGKIREHAPSVPTTLLIDRKGMVKFKHTGRITEADLRRSLTTALAEIKQEASAGAATATPPRP